MSGKSSTPTAKTKKGKLAKKELPAGIENISSNPTFEQGVKLFEQDMYVEAIEVFGTYAQQGDLLARQYLARCYLRMERYDSAYKHFSILSECQDEKMRDYALSIMAAIEETRGDVNKAIKILRSLPQTPRNILNLSLMYWKKYKTTKEEFAIFEALKLVNSLDLDQNPPRLAQYANHLKALFHQAKRDFFVSEDFYKRALELSKPDIERGKVLIDFGSLLIERGRLKEAEEILLEAAILVEGKSEVQEALCNKWLGILYVLQEEYHKAKPLLEKAIKVLRDKALLQELAGISYILSDFAKQKDFFEAAEYFAAGLFYQQLSKEVNIRDEKVVDFYSTQFINSDHNSGLG